MKMFNMQENGNSPIKRNAIFLAVVLWNILCMIDWIPFWLNDKKEGIPLGVGTKLAVGSLLAASIFTLTSEQFRKLVLKEDRELADVKKLLYFLIAISGLFLLMLSFADLQPAAVINRKQ